MDRQPTPSESPQRLGRYALLGTIGRGGMGEVVRARAYGPGGATKDLCLKRIHADRLAQPGALERFVDEARVALRLAHGNIVAVFDFGRAGEEHYLAMEWVDGADLRTILADAEARGEPLPPAVAAHVAAEVARALGYAHEHGVVHCDVKPANVLIARTGDVKLTDFGVATAIAAQRGGGTDGYVPPEQGRCARATPGSDVYALGVMLLEMLSGDRTTENLAAHAPAPLAPILSGMLDPDPSRRSREASQVARDLEAFVARERAERQVAPRDELARRAAETAAARQEEPTSGAYEATASFARDGERAFTEPTASANTRGRRAAPRSRRAIAAASAALALAALTGGVVAALDATRERAAQPVAAGVMEARSAAVALPSPATGVSSLASAQGTESGAQVRRADADGADGIGASLGSRPLRTERRASPRGARPRAGRAARSSDVPEVLDVAAEPLVEEAPAHLRINAIPWADVELDERPLGETPLLDVEMSAGRHTLRFTNSALGAVWVRSIEVSPGERRDLVVDLTAAPR